MVIKTIRLLRVEDSKGLGYKDSLDSVLQNYTELGIHSICFSDEYFEYRPMPEDDGIAKGDIKPYHLFAFESYSDVERWFWSADMALGALMGAVIVEYEVLDTFVLFGGRQVAFDSREAERVSVHPMNYKLSEAERGSTFDFIECYNEIANCEMMVVDVEVERVLGSIEV
ncbi:conserved hypothetical protein [Vibrio chagasii]|nr:conserved hypothetical protein [Vibrio chagasii]